MSIERRPDGYLLSDDPRRIDVDRVHRWLSTDAYWALGRSRETVVRAFAASMPFGVYRERDGSQVAVARAVTDGATFAWLCDVYVARDERDKGLGKWLVATVRDRLTALGIPRILLATATPTTCTPPPGSRRWPARTGGWSWTGGR